MPISRIATYGWDPKTDGGEQGLVRSNAATTSLEDLKDENEEEEGPTDIPEKRVRRRSRTRRKRTKVARRHAT